MSSNSKRPCPRCGFRRYVHHTRPDIICKDCADVDPGWPDLERREAS